MPRDYVQKQISIYLPIAQWRALRDEAARQRVPITELCRQWLGPHVQHLVETTPAERGWNPLDNPPSAMPARDTNAPAETFWGAPRARPETAGEPLVPPTPPAATRRAPTHLRDALWRSERPVLPADTP